MFKMLLIQFVRRLCHKKYTKERGGDYLQKDGVMYMRITLVTLGNELKVFGIV